MGFSGSGKSTLAKKLGNYFNIPYLHLDNVKFYGDWQERSVEEQNEILRKYIQNNDSWVIDGNHIDIAPERFFQTDISIFLDYNRIYCYIMCLKRYRKNFGKSRESCPCVERFEVEFKKWILFKGRKKSRKKELLIELNKTNGQKHIFKNKKQLNKWLDSIGIWNTTV